MVQQQKDQARGRLASVAASMLMRLLYAARFSRFDLLRAVNGLATFVAYWDEDCDRKLHHLMSYVFSTLHHRMWGWIGDPPEGLNTHTYADANYAGCVRPLRSTSGGQFHIQGKHSYFPIAARSIRQTCVTNSTPEAEIISLHLALKTMLLPSIDIWSKILPPGYKNYFHEDNTACIQIIKTGKLLFFSIQLRW